MKLHEIGSLNQRSAKRVGRGIGSGKGKTAGRGTKGQRSRTGFSLKVTFEGGQNSLIHRLPKLRGFHSIHKPAQVIYTDQLNSLAAGKTYKAGDLAAAGQIKNPKQRVKLLFRGEVKTKLNLEINAASRSAIAAVEAAGGAVKVGSQAVADQPAQVA